MKKINYVPWIIAFLIFGASTFNTVSLIYRFDFSVFGLSVFFYKILITSPIALLSFFVVKYLSKHKNYSDKVIWYIFGFYIIFFGLDVFNNIPHIFDVVYNKNFGLILDIFFLNIVVKIFALIFVLAFLNKLSYKRRFPNYFLWFNIFLFTALYLSFSLFILIRDYGIEYFLFPRIVIFLLLTSLGVILTYKKSIKRVRGGSA